ncbi:MAG: hypothetical protein HC908_08430 [Calothrix sp. SM1_7_51]|nr:hypothetical protein [Calothrix sp. SM1_7_51]
MRQRLKSFATLSAMSVITFAPIFSFTNSAKAQPQGMQGSYIGVGGGTSGNLGVGTLGGRINISNSPFLCVQLYFIIPILVIQLLLVLSLMMGLLLRILIFI